MVSVQRLRENNMQVRFEETFLASTHFDYLGCHLTSNGVKPQERTFKAMLNITKPKNVRELHRFIGLVQCCRDIFRRRSDVLHPLTTAASKYIPKHTWTPLMNKSFNEIKRIISQNVLLVRPYLNEPFGICTNASDFQLGSVIVQNICPLAFYSRKLTTTQRDHSVG